MEECPKKLKLVKEFNNMLNVSIQDAMVVFVGIGAKQPETLTIKNALICGHAKGFQLATEMMKKWTNLTGTELLELARSKLPANVFSKDYVDSVGSAENNT